MQYRVLLGISMVQRVQLRISTALLGVKISIATVCLRGIINRFSMFG